jgi:heptaprenyl diphosphate synthase
MSKTRKLAFLSIMLSQALVLSIIESWIPLPFVLPGVKLGLANIVTLVIIVLFGLREALAVVALRCVITSMFGGGVVMLLFSLTGGILSTFVMVLLYKKMFRAFSLIGISVAGSVVHNVGQLGAASLIMKDVSVFSYLTVLLVSGVVMGSIIGVTGNLLIGILKKTGKMNDFS